MDITSEAIAQAIANAGTTNASIFTVELPIEIDRLQEETEIVDLVVRLGHGPGAIEHVGTTRLTIPNTDFILMDFEQGLYSVAEGDAVQVRLSLTPPPQNDEYLTVTFTPDGDTPTANDDDWRIREALADGTLFVPAGSSEVVFTIEAIADGLFEGLDVERFALTADLTSSKFLNDTVRETTLEISSPDEPRVAISGPGTRELREGRGSVDINVELINIPTVGITQAIRLALELSGENSAEATLSTSTLTLNENGVLSGRITVTAIDDDDSEGDGRFLVRVKSYSYTPLTGTVVTDEPLAGSSYVLIVDDDDNVSNRVITVDFADMPTPSAVEGEALELGVVLSEPIPAENEYALNDYVATVVAGADLFEDISFYAPRISLANNGLYEQQFADGFEFELYGQIYNSVRVAANGFLSFGDAYTDGTGSNINADLELGRAGTPGSAGAPIIAALWDSLSVSGEGAGVYVDLQGSAPNRRYIFQWDDVAVLNAPGELISFQVVLFENGNAAELRYAPLAEETEVLDNATIGISDGEDSFRSAAFDGSGDNLGDIKKGSAILLRPLYSHLRLVPVPGGDLVTDDLYPLSQLGGATADEVITVGTLQDSIEEGLEFVSLRLISEVDRFEVPGGSADLVVAVRDNAASTVELRALNPSPAGIEHLGPTDQLAARLTIDPPLGRRLNEAYTRIDVSGNEYQELSETAPLTMSLSYDDDGYATIDIPGFALNVHGTDVGLSNGRVFVRDDGYLVFTDAPNAPTYSRADNASLEQITTYGPAGRNELFGVGGGTLIAPLWINFVDGNGETFYRIEGTSPNRVLTVEWRGYLTSSNHGTPENTFQVRLSESTNIIEFHYQNIISPLPTTSPTRNSTVGIVTHNGGIEQAEQIGHNMQNTVRSGQEIRLVPADVLILESPLNENLQVSIDGGTSFEALPFDIGSQIGPDATEVNLVFKPTTEVDSNSYAETVLRLATSNADAFELGDDLEVALGREPIEIYFDGVRSFPGRFDSFAAPALNPGEVLETNDPTCCGVGGHEGNDHIYIKLKLSRPLDDGDDLALENVIVTSDTEGADFTTGSDGRRNGQTTVSLGSFDAINGEYELLLQTNDDKTIEANDVITFSLVGIPEGVGLVLGDTTTVQITILANQGVNDERPYAFTELELDRVNEGRVVRALISLDRDLDLNDLPDGLTPDSVLFRLRESNGHNGELPTSESNYVATSGIQPNGIDITAADLAGSAGTVHTVELTLKQDDLDTGDRTAFLRFDTVDGGGVDGGSSNDRSKGDELEYTIVDNEAYAGFGPVTRGREGGTVELTADFLRLPIEDLDGENAYVREQVVASYPGFGGVGNVTNIDNQVGFFEFGSDLLYYGRDYYGAYVSQDGFLVLSSDTASDAATVNAITGLGDSNLSLSDAQLADLPIVAPYWDNFQSDGATIRVGSVGTAGQSDYEIVVEWSNLKFADRTERVTFQVRINLLSGQIRYYYGDVSDGYGRGSTIGLGDGRGTPLTIVDEPGRSLSADARYVNDGTLIRLDPNYVYIVTERVGSDPGFDSREDILVGVPEILRAVDFTTTVTGVQWIKEFDVIDELDSVGQLPSTDNPNFIWETKLVLVSLNPNVNLGGGLTETVNGRVLNRLTLDEYLIVDEEFEIKDLVVPITSVSEGQAFRATVDLSAGFPEIYRSGNSYARELNSGEPFNNIATTGTSLTGSGEVDFPFPFEFFGSYTRTVYVSNHGFLTLGSNAGDIEPGSINGGLGLIDANADLSKPVKGFLGIVPYGTKLSEGTRYYSVSGEFPNRRFTIQWNDYKIGTGTTLRPIGGTGERVTFQAVLHESTNRIEFKYDDLPVDPFLNGQIGITAPPGEVVCTVSCQRTVEDNLRRSFLVNGGSVIFTPGRDLLENSYDAVPTESEFEDISSYGTRLDVPEDGVVRERTVIENNVAKEKDLSLPFQFAINNRLHSQLHIGENGFVILEQNVKLPNKGFDLTGAEYITNNDLSDGINGNVVIAPFWDDLIIEPDPDNPATANSGIYYAELGTGNDRRAIIQWEQVRSTSASDTPITFQVVLFRTGTDSIAGGFLNSSILLRYKDVTASVPAGGGGTASIGFFNGERDTVLIGFNEPVLNDGDAFAIVPPPALLELDLVDPEQRSDFDVTLQFPINLTSQLIDAVNSHNGEFPIRLTTENLQTSMDSEVEPNEEIKFVVRYTYDNLNLRSQKTAIVRVTDSGAEERTITSTIVLDAPDKDRAAGIVHEGSSLHTLNVTLDAGALLGVDLSSLQRDFRSSGVLPLPSDQFEDISGLPNATRLAVSDEAGVVATLGEFPPFQLFEHDINKALYVDSNGFLLPLLGDATEADAFDSGANFGANSDLALQESAVPFVETAHNSVGIIAPLWDDLVLGDGAVYAAHLGEPGGPDSRYIIQWDNVGFASGVGDSDNSITFQVVFYEGSSTRYEFRYKDVSVTNPANSNGNGATIGISEDAESGSHIEVGLNQPILTDNSRVFFSARTLELRTDQPEQFGAPFRDDEGNVKAYYDLRPALLSNPTATITVEVYDDDLRERAMLLPFEVYAPTLEEDSRIKLTGTTRGEFLVIDDDLARATPLSTDRVRLTEGESTTIQFEIRGSVDNSTIRVNNMGVAEITQFTPSAVTANDVTEHGQADYSDYRVSFIPASGETGREVTRVTDEGIVEVLVEALNDDYYELREDIEVVFQLHISDNADGSVSFIDTYSFTLRIDDTDEPQIELVSDDPTRQDEDGARLELRAQLNNHPPLGNPGTISGTIRFNSVAERGVDFSVSGIGAPDDGTDSIYSKEFGTFTIPRSADSVARVRPVIATIEAIADNVPEPTEWIDLAITELEYQEYDTEQGIYYVKRIIDEYKLTDPDLIRFELEFANDDFVTARFAQQDVPVASEGEALPLQVVLDRPLPRLYAYTADLLDVSTMPSLDELTITVITRDNEAAVVPVTFGDGFNFNLFGNSYDKVYVHRNGFVTFGDQIDLSYVNADDAGDRFLSQQPFIAPLWDALTVGSGKVVAGTIGTAPQRRFVIEWSNVQFAARGVGTERLRFQVVLHEDNGQVQFNYDRVAADPSATAVNFGNSAWIGIGAGDGQSNVEIGHNQPILENGTKITFTPPLKGLVLVTQSESEFEEVFPLDVTNNFTLNEEPTLYVVAAENDGPEDDRETHELQLDIANGEEIIQVSDPDRAAVTILDLDKPRVRFGQREYTVTEGQALTITLALGGRLPLDTPVKVALEFALDSTAGPSDFSITPEEVMISSAMPNPEFILSATSDILPDDGEFVTLNLISDNTDLLTVNLPAAVQISSRAPAIDISITDAMVTEGDEVEIVLTLSEPIAPTRFNGNYSIEETSETFNTIIGASSGSPLANFPVTRTLPFDFELYGGIYTEIYISQNGFVYFVGPNAPTLDLVGIEANPDFRGALPGYPVIAPLWDEYSTTGTSGVYVRESGTQPNRKYEIEWAEFIANDQTGTAAERRFQLFLYEGSNRIEINYGKANSNSATVAISGQRQFEQLYFNEVGVSDNTRVIFTPQTVSDIVTVSSPIEYGPGVPRYIRAGEETPVGFDSGVGTLTEIEELRIDSNGNARSDAFGVRQTLPFEFEFYNTIYEHIYVSNAGLIHFVGADDTAPEFTFDNPDFRVNPPDYPTIAPLWDGYSIPASGMTVGATGVGVYYEVSGDAPNRSYRIEWDRLPVAGQPDAVPFEFALVLYEGSNYIDLLYRDANGNSATVAISGPRHSSGIIPFQQFHFNELATLATPSEIRLRPQIFSDFVSSGDSRLPRDFSLADFSGTDKPSLSFYASAAIDNLYEEQIVDGQVTHDTATILLELAGDAELELGDSRGQLIITLEEYSALAEFDQALGGEVFDLEEDGFENLSIVLRGVVPNDRETTFSVRPRPVSEADSTDYVLDNPRLGLSNANNTEQIVKVTGKENGLIEPEENLQLFLEPEPDNDGSVVARRQPYNPDPIRGRDSEDAFVLIRDTDEIELGFKVADDILVTPEASRGDGIEIELIGSNLIGTGIQQEIVVELEIRGSATNGEDYTLRGVLNNRVGIPAGSQGTALTLFINDDEFYEEDETIRISVSGVEDSDENSLTFSASNEIEIVIEDNDRIGVSLDRILPATLREGGSTTELFISLAEPVSFVALGTDDNYTIVHTIQATEEFANTTAIATDAVVTTQKLSELTSTIWLADSSEQEQFVEFELYGQLNGIGSGSQLFYRKDGLVGFFQGRDSEDALGSASASSLAEISKLVDRTGQPAPSASDLFFAPLWNVFDTNTGTITIAYEPQLNSESEGDVIGYLPHIRWENLRYFRDSQSDITFGMRMLPDGRIQFYYETLELPNPAISLTDFLNDTTIGIASGLASTRNGFYRKEVDADQIQEGSVVTLSPPDNVLRLTRSGGSPFPEDFQTNLPQEPVTGVGRECY